MINKNFKQDWRISDGEVDVYVFETNHISLGIDKCWFGLAFEVSKTLRMIYFKLLFFNIRIY